MKTKTIKTVIQKKIDDWLETIDDALVREACRKDFIVTGGSIASMLLREKVNDYDVYFKTKKTVQAVADYYVKKINSIYINNISDSIIEVHNSQNLPNKEYENEVDQSKWTMFKEGLERADEDRVKIYIPHIGYWRKTDERSSKDLSLPDEGTYRPVYLTENAITLSDEIQLVIRFFGEPEEIHKNYDFVHATNYYHDNKLVLRPSALESLLTKELIYIGSRYPVTSVIRAKKFVLRGFTISAGTYLKILWQVAELNLKDPIVLQEQLVGVDVAYFALLIEALTGIDESKLTYNYVSEIIDRIFTD